MQCSRCVNSAAGALTAAQIMPAGYCYAGHTAARPDVVMVTFSVVNQGRATAIATHVYLVS